MKKIFENKKLVIGLIILVVFVFSLNYFFCGEGRFVRTGDMVIPRFAHSAVLLQDGKVLITGGYFYDRTYLKKEYSKSAELYDPKTGNFTRINDMNFGRAYHSSILLNDGKVLIVCGGHAEAELYNPQNGKFTITGSMPMVFLDGAGEQASIVKLKNGDVYIIDGIFKDSITWIINYSPKNGKFSLVKKTKLYHGAQNAVLLPNENILIIGGYQPQKAEIYNPDKNTLRFTKEETDLEGYFMTLLLNNKVLLTKRDSYTKSDLYDFEKDEFSETKYYRRGKCTGLCTSTMLQNGKAIILGIKGSKQEIYNPQGETFKNTGRVKLNSFWHTATLLQNGDVLITGGITPRIVTTSSNKAFLYKTK